MKRVALVTSLLVYFGVAVHAQQQLPPLLVRAAHCLVVKGFLPHSKARKLTLGYLLDEHSYPGEKVIYVVAFKAPARSNGSVFAVFLTTKDGHDTFNIQNNATFVLSNKEPNGVSFVNSPLGGVWTQNHLASAIREIEKQSRFMIPVNSLLAAGSCSCESYAAPQVTKNE